MPQTSIHQPDIAFLVAYDGVCPVPLSATPLSIHMTTFHRILAVSLFISSSHPSKVAAQIVRFVPQDFMHYFMDCTCNHVIVAKLPTSEMIGVGLK